MKTENLDKLLGELDARLQPLGLPQGSAVRRDLGAARIKDSPRIKVEVFLNTITAMHSIADSAAATKNPRFFELSCDVIVFCEAVIFYYMLKGAGCEAEIAQHRGLDVIMGVLK